MVPGRQNAATQAVLGWENPLMRSGLIGWGGFQVYDGLFQHKVLGLHQIRYGVDLLPYDLAWNLLGALGVLVGIGLLFGTARSIAERRERP